MSSKYAGLAPNSSPGCPAPSATARPVPGGRVAVVEDRHHTEQGRTGDEVPHHPARGGEEEQPVAAAQVHDEVLELELL
jgi:hypothetical protein